LSNNVNKRNIKMAKELPLASAQAKIPGKISKEVIKAAKAGGEPASNFYRKWIVEGYTKAKKSKEL
jgi:transcriptional/translational regulatory protein YebC/TACO1